jgi:2-dehydro-3-deoxyphosphogluconate aldolase/(4S)-4-hydroxy-2-oxoglutarate aldolase
MLATGATVLLGALTPSEVMWVSGLGAHAVKIFPANLGGPAYLRAPFPDLAFVPTGGVNPETLAEWLSAGAVAAGAGGELCSARDIADARFADITARAARFTAAVAAWRSS